MRSLRVLALIGLFAASPTAQARGLPSFEPVQPAAGHWSADDVNDMAFDAEGRLWVATMWGLDVFDGAQVLQVGNGEDGSARLPATGIYRLKVLQDLVWLATDSGLFSYTPSTGAFGRVALPRPDQAFDARHALPPRPVLHLAVRGEELVFAERAGAGEVFSVRVDAGTRAKLAQGLTVPATPLFKVPTPPVDGLLLTRGTALHSPLDRAEPRAAGEGVVWAATCAGLVHAGALTTPWLQPNLSDRPSCLAHVSRDDDGQVWLGDTAGSVQRLGAPAWRTLEDQHASQITSVLPGPHNHLFVGTTGGLAVWGGSGLLHPPSADTQLGLPSLQVDHLLTGAADDLWVAISGGHGIYREPAAAGGVSRTRVGLPSGAPAARVQAFASAGDALWIGTGTGQMVAPVDEPSAAKHISGQPAGLSGSTMDIVADGRGCLFISMADGSLWHADPAQASYEQLLAPSAPRRDRGAQREHAVLRGPSGPRNLALVDGTLWIGTSSDGLHRFHLASRALSRVDLAYPGLRADPPTTAHALQADGEGGVWIGTHRHGLLQANADGEVHRIDTLTREGARLPSLDVRSVTPRLTGGWWVATTQGLASLDLDGVLTPWPLNARLPNLHTYAALEDGNGALWISHNAGISRYNRLTDEILTLDTRDGLQNREFNTNAFGRLADDSLLFGGVHGYNVINPRSFEARTYGLKPALSHITVNGQRVYHHLQQRPEQFVIEGAHDTVTVQLTERRLLNLDAVDLYASINEGPWMPVNRSGSLTLTNLSAGPHAVRLRAGYRGRPPGNSVHALSLYRTPAWWERATTRFGGSLLAFAALLWWVRRRDAAAALTQQRLEQAVEARTQRLAAEVDQHKATEKALRVAKSEALAATEAKARFLANVTHELRTPLNGVIGIAQLLRGTELSEDQQEYVSIMESSGAQLVSLVDDVLDFSKLEGQHVTLEMLAVPAEDLFGEAIRAHLGVATAQGIDLLLALSPEVPDTLCTDPTRLRQILGNLMSNAIKFTQAGHVQLAVAVTGGGAHDRRLLIQVNDTGCGMHPEQVPHIFGAFTQADASITRKYGGTGLGLAITKRIAEAFAGSIDVETAPGEGTRFTINLPLLGAPENDTPPTAPLAGKVAILHCTPPERERAMRDWLVSWGASVLSPEAAPHHALADFAVVSPDITPRPPARRTVCLLPPGAGANPTHRAADTHLRAPVLPSKLLQALTDHHAVRGASPQGLPLAARPGRILVAEDNLVNQRLMLRILGAAGHQVDVVGDGREAVRDVSRAFREGQQLWDIIVMDLQMPVLDGADAAAEIRALVPPELCPPIVALTGSDESASRARSRAAGMAGYLVKPVRPADLVRTLDDVVRGRSG